jgi:hypothetical protein
MVLLRDVSPESGANDADTIDKDTAAMHKVEIGSSAADLCNGLLGFLDGSLVVLVVTSDDKDPSVLVRLGEEKVFVAVH